MFNAQRVPGHGDEHHVAVVVSAFQESKETRGKTPQGHSARYLLGTPT